MNLEFILDIIRLSLKGLTERKVRAALTIIGIAIGPLALVTMTSVVEGYSDYIVGQIEGLGQNLILVQPSSSYRLTEHDLNIIKNLNGVKYAAPIFTLSGKLSRDNKEISIIATDLDIIMEGIGGLKLIKGRIPPSSNIINVAIGHDIAFKDNSQRYYIDDAITFMYYKPKKSGGGIEVKRSTMIITGIFNKFGGAFLLNPDNTIFMNTKAAEKILGLKEWSGILILSRNTEIVKAIIKEIKNKFGDSVDIISFEGIAKTAESITSAINFIIFSTSLSAFAVAIAGVTATMITSVIERTREIGVMKALGFTNNQVLGIILAESLLMSLIGAIVGIILGIGGAYALAARGLTIRGSTYSTIIYVSPDFTPLLMAKALGITALVGLLGGAFPAYKAATIPPAVALRYE